MKDRIVLKKIPAIDVCKGCIFANSIKCVPIFDCANSIWVEDTEPEEPKNITINIEKLTDVVVLTNPADVKTMEVLEKALKEHFTKVVKGGLK